MSQVDYVRVLEGGLAAADNEIRLLKVERNWYMARLAEAVDEMEKVQSWGLRWTLLFCGVYGAVVTLIVVLVIGDR